MHKPILIAKLKKSKLVLTIGVIVFSLFFIYVILVNNNAKTDNLYYVLLFVVLVFLILALYSSYHLISFPKIYLYAKKIELVNYFGFKRREILIQDVKSRLLKEYSSKYGNYLTLYLRLTNSEVIYLKCDLYDNFHPIKIKLIHNKPNDKALHLKLMKKEHTYYAIMSFVFGLVFFCGSIFFTDIKKDLDSFLFSTIVSIVLISLGFYFFKKKLRLE